VQRAPFHGRNIDDAADDDRDDDGDSKPGGGRDDGQPRVSVTVSAKTGDILVAVGQHRPQKSSSVPALADDIEDVEEVYSDDDDGYDDVDDADDDPPTTVDASPLPSGNAPPAAALDTVLAAVGTSASSSGKGDGALPQAATTEKPWKEERQREAEEKGAEIKREKPAVRRPVAIPTALVVSTDDTADAAASSGDSSGDVTGGSASDAVQSAAGAVEPLQGKADGKRLPWAHAAVSSPPRSSAGVDVPEPLVRSLSNGG
jgi:hypothetical protein